jgi:tetratricopeptide (TPR) repeat protein
MQAPDPPPDDAVAHYKRGNAHKDAGEPQAALKSYNRALELNPSYAHALCNRGVVLASLRRLHEALESYERALAIEPRDAITHYNRGVLLHEQKDWNGALQSYELAIQFDPGRFHAHFNRGLVQRELQQWDAALASFDRAISINPEVPAPYFNRGVLQQQLRQFDAALQSYAKAAALNPNLYQAFFKSGSVYQELKDPDKALASYDRAIAIRKEYPEAWLNRGIALHDLQRLNDALASYEQAIAFNPGCAEAWFGRATTLMQKREVDAALVNYDRAIELKPDFAEAQYNRSLALLLAGDYAAGWQGYEWRWQNAARLFMGEPRVFRQPLWLGGESLNGKRILIYGEQGLGDTLQFCRYVKLVADLGAEVILEVQAPLVNLCKDLGGVSRIISAGSLLPDFDYQCPLMSLPLALGTTLQSIPANTPYLDADAGKVGEWRSRLGARSRPRIGLVWTGNAIQGNDRNRSIPVAEVIALLPREFDYVCLQREIRPAERDALAANPWIRTVEAQLEDFSDTAALAATTDLVISVCTSAVHLAGALGLKVWALLAFDADWRWLLHRNDSPWYPTMTLYRQATPGDWRGVFERVAADLHGEFS